ncbi:ORF6N domain-containing protein [bacterium]|nr:ORF6N domain-containing protein [bacterium]
MGNKKDAVNSVLVLQERIEKKIFLIRGKKVMLDRDLALLYEVTTGNLNKAISRNLDRFPDDCVPRTYVEVRVLQNGKLKKDRRREVE